MYKMMMNLYFSITKKAKWTTFSSTHVTPLRLNPQNINFVMFVLMNCTLSKVPPTVR